MQMQVLLRWQLLSAARPSRTRQQQHQAGMLPAPCRTPAWMPGVLRTPSGLFARAMPPLNSACFTRSTGQSG